LNAARVAFAKKYNVAGEFQLSAANFYFWSRMEKANTYLESMIKLAEEPLDAKTVECFNDWVTSGPSPDI
jgi:bleomycin hydrolase